MGSVGQGIRGGQEEANELAMVFVLISSLQIIEVRVGASIN